MARKNKVEESPHFNEIVKRLSEGESGRKVSAWLENTYNEKISFAALNRYKSKNIRMEDRVEAELNKRAKKKKKKPKKNKKVQAQTEKEVQRQADEKETAEETINSVAETIAINMEGVASVAAQFPERFEEACKDAQDPNSNVTSKDVARLSLDANKLYNEYFKQDEPVEVNINNELIGLAESIEKSKKEFSVE
ncbi:hypothetical protein [Methanobrevibacter ruminantium]|uniref:hypothetical protein n=1 Tax=Methanobrevibacter ruminantium TaxID=83816 RepID=UPI0026EAEE71|nr:hypothetical protein [Methanobrevibacter ruminantium]